MPWLQQVDQRRCFVLSLVSWILFFGFNLASLPAQTAEPNSSPALSESKHRQAIFVDLGQIPFSLAFNAYVSTALSYYQNFGNLGLSLKMPLEFPVGVGDWAAIGLLAGPVVFFNPEKGSTSGFQLAARAGFVYPFDNNPHTRSRNLAARFEAEIAYNFPIYLNLPGIDLGLRPYLGVSWQDEIIYLVTGMDIGGLF